MFILERLFVAYVCNEMGGVGLRLVGLKGRHGLIAAAFLL